MDYNPANIKSYSQRALEEDIQPFLARPEAIAILGPRQAGKTTLARRLARQLTQAGKKVQFITFESRADRELFEKNIEGFKAYIADADVVIIDEFQYAAEGGQKLKYVYDTLQKKFIITGSSSLELTFQTGTYMVGRLVTFMLWPFSFPEYVVATDAALAPLLKRPELFDEAVAQKLQPALEQYALWGGYPAVALADSAAEKQTLLQGILSNYLLHDIKDLLELASDDALVSLLQFLGSQMGNLVNYKELSNSSNLDFTAVKKHLTILQHTYILDLVRPYFTNKRTELTKMPKVYFEDLGFRNTSIQDMRPLALRADAGALVENFVYIHLKHQATELAPVKFWRTKSGAEVDFIWQHGATLVPIEVKYAARPTVGKSLMSFIDKFSPPEAIIFTQNIAATEKRGPCMIHFIPVYYAAAAIQSLRGT